MVWNVLFSYSKGEQIFYFYTIIINLIGFILMGIDKYKARKEIWRIKEFTLIFISFVGGSIGSLIGMVIFKHKIHKKKFYIGIPLIYILNLIVKHIIIYYL